jgi:hypothetical protein
VRASVSGAVARQALRAGRQTGPLRWPGLHHRAQGELFDMRANRELETEPVVRGDRLSTRGSVLSTSTRAARLQLFADDAVAVPCSTPS